VRALLTLASVDLEALLTELDEAHGYSGEEDESDASGSAQAAHR
jgi:hypothetical protein